MIKTKKYLKNKSNPEDYAPNAYDVLTALTKTCPSTLENFCADYGYDFDSRTAERIYNACMNEWLNLKILFSDDELEIMAYIN